MIEAIYWAIDNDVDVINMSFGMSNSSKALYEAIKAQVLKQNRRTPYE